MHATTIVTESHSFHLQNMASRESNPLRPYYVPPIGLSPSESLSASSAAHIASHASSRTIIGGSARDLLSDLDYSDYLEASPSVSEWFRDLLDRAVWKYSSAFLAQPFDVAKTLLQIYVVPDEEEAPDSQDVRRRQSQHLRDDTSDQVIYVLQCDLIQQPANGYRIPYPQTTRATSSPALHQRHPHLLLLERANLGHRLRIEPATSSSLPLPNIGCRSRTPLP